MVNDMVQIRRHRPVPAKLAHIRRGKLLAASSLTPVEEDGIGAGRFRLQRRPNGYWAVFDGRKYVVTTHKRDLGKALDFLELYEAQAEAEYEGLLDVRNAKAAQVMAEFLAVEGRPKSAQRSIRHAFEVLTPFVGNKRVRELNGKWLKATMEELKAVPLRQRNPKRPPKIGYAEASRVVFMRWLLAAISRWCVENGALHYTPFKKPPDPPGRKVVYSSEEQNIILRWSRGTEDYDPATRTWTPAKGPLCAREVHERRLIDRMFTVSLSTASRPGNVWGLARRRSLDCPYIVGGVLHRVPFGFTPPPNKKAPRVRLSPATMVEIARFEKEDPPGELYILRPFGKSRPLGRDACAERWAKAMTRLGIKGRRHACRHTGVTGLIAANVHPILISALAGMSVETIEKHYNHNDGSAIQHLAFPGVDALLRDGIGVAALDPA